MLTLEGTQCIRTRGEALILRDAECSSARTGLDPRLSHVQSRHPPACVLTALGLRYGAAFPWHLQAAKVTDAMMGIFAQDMRGVGQKTPDRRVYHDNRNLSVTRPTAKGSGD
jgi:hypothetical protein